MLYYSHNRGGTVQWQSKATDFDSKASGTQRDLNKEERRRDIESDPSDESQCVVGRIKVTRHSPFTEAPQEAYETSVSQFENIGANKQDFKDSSGKRKR